MPKTAPPTRPHNKGTKIRNGEEIAIKVDKPNILSLKHETRILHYLYSANIKHIPPVYWFGKIQESFCLVLPFYQVNLYEYTTKKNVTQKHLNIIIWNMFGMCNIISVSPHNAISIYIYIDSPIIIIG